MKKSIIGVVLAILPVMSHAIDPEMQKIIDEQNNRVLKEVKTFLKEYPMVTKDVASLGLADMWQRIEGLNKMIYLYNENADYFHRPGKSEPRIFHINRRVWSHQSRSHVYIDDPVVSRLKQMIWLHASFASRYMNKEIKFGVYNEVAAYVKTNGRYLAEQIEKKYGNGKRVLKPIPEINW